jgi:hypothetical protein
MHFFQTNPGQGDHLRGCQLYRSRSLPAVALLPAILGRGFSGSFIACRS